MCGRLLALESSSVESAGAEQSEQLDEICTSHRGLQVLVRIIGEGDGHDHDLEQNRQVLGNNAIRMLFSVVQRGKLPFEGESFLSTELWHLLSGKSLTISSECLMAAMELGISIVSTSNCDEEAHRRLFSAVMKILKRDPRAATATSSAAMHPGLILRGVLLYSALGSSIFNYYKIYFKVCIYLLTWYNGNFEGICNN